MALVMNMTVLYNTTPELDVYQAKRVAAASMTPQI
jgi:hypothetical protein